MIERHSVDASAERQFLTGLIVSDRFAQEARVLYRPELMSAVWARTVADWCIKYHERYGKAPGKDIQHIYEAQHAILSGEQAEIIAELLSGLNEEHTRSTFNAEYALDRSERYFRARALEHLATSVQGALHTDNLEDAEQMLLEHRAPLRPSTVGINPFTDEEAIYHAYERHEDDVLFRLPGALGQFVGPIVREDFIGVLGPEKRGKSFWLQELGMWAVRHKCNTAWLGVGDMSLSQYIQRTHNYISRTHHRAHGQVVRYPVLDCRWNQLDECDRQERTGLYAVLRHRDDGFVSTPYEEARDHKPCRHCAREDPKAFRGAVWYAEKHLERPRWQDLLRAGERLEQQTGKGRMRLACYPGGSVNVQGIRAQLEYWEQYENWVPDVVVVDYADVLGPEDNREVNYRHQQNHTWAALRALAQERSCVVITATQADAASYDKAVLTERNFSEDKRKFSHVTMMLTLNQTPVEKQRGVLRVGRLAVRDSGYDARKQVHVLECREMGRPHLASFF